jgi:hypothetical protein
VNQTLEFFPREMWNRGQRAAVGPTAASKTGARFGSFGDKSSLVDTLGIERGNPVCLGRGLSSELGHVRFWMSYHHSSMW